MKRGNVWLVALMSVLSACAPVGLNSGSGICSTDNGDVNTYQIYGKWKKLSPYSPAETPDQLNYDFDLMIVEEGAQVGTVVTPICEASVVNGGLSEVLYRAVYENNIPSNQLTIQYTAGTGSGSVVTANYSFSGSCDSTQLTLSYSTGVTETYALYSTDVESGDCAGTSSSSGSDGSSGN